ncbi:hypothetical protein ALI22I_03620 [Saccharothrix sp. ALI-22-I]|uniref:hypothetical protein n=1 Tax=Saccharothrix sp. ALI-22-I TaxID=1933778 RepID=UPI00097C49E4|nr:hypothetical protein [Saccharothrix sp. ALI-22-I]ONI92498.1 hypothetical protein ALI22I_03620 [Saccharothrix sp. ALI-22-I]
MARLLVALDDYADVEWNVFGLIDDDRVEPGEPGWGALGSPKTMLTGKNGAIFRSGGAMHRAAVRLEAWDGPPESPDGPWDAVWEDEITLSSGVLRLAAVTAGVSEETLRVGAPGVYAVRVCCRGREAALEAGFMPYTGEVVEHWVMQFWPR